ncbi:MAG: PLDc N-terminal domain-containing protein [Candidatus Woesearchaeota archaeon]|nr:PLDc N-terminal domain-containing protein [Candidatus Woesearchaeota archaeon]
MAILGGNWGILGIVALIAAIWVIYEAATNKSLSTGQKVLWIVCGVFFSIITALVYYLVVKKK